MRVCRWILLTNYGIKERCNRYMNVRSVSNRYCQVLRLRVWKGGFQIRRKPANTTVPFQLNSRQRFLQLCEDISDDPALLILCDI